MIYFSGFANRRRLVNTSINYAKYELNDRYALQRSASGEKNILYSLKFGTSI